MKYNTSLDKFAKLATGGILSLFLVIMGISLNVIYMTEALPTILVFNAVANSIFLVFILVSFLRATRSYTIEAGYLIIDKLINGKKIKLSDIKELGTIDDLMMGEAVRDFGMGGLFGYNGKYNIPKLGSVALYGKQKKNGILIVTSQGEKIVITPDDGSVIDKLKG